MDLNWLILVATILTVAMIAYKNILIGIPAILFWGLAGYIAYKSSLEQFDTSYLLFIVCMVMAIFTALIAYTFRDKKIVEAKDTKSKNKIANGKKEVKEIKQVKLPEKIADIPTPIIEGNHKKRTDFIEID